MNTTLASVIAALGLTAAGGVTAMTLVADAGAEPVTTPEVRVEVVEPGEPVEAGDPTHEQSESPDGHDDEGEYGEYEDDDHDEYEDGDHDG